MVAHFFEGHLSQGRKTVQLLNHSSVGPSWFKQEAISQIYNFLFSMMWDNTNKIMHECI